MHKEKGNKKERKGKERKGKEIEDIFRDTLNKDY